MVAQNNSVAIVYTLDPSDTYQREQVAAVYSTSEVAMEDISKEVEVPMSKWIPTPDGNVLYTDDGVRIRVQNLGLSG